jgi:hypothetical protein
MCGRKQKNTWILIRKRGQKLLCVVKGIEIPSQTKKKGKRLVEGNQMCAEEREKTM